MKAMLSKYFLGDFPTLPSHHAILLGWASELPVLVQMNQRSEHHRPKSDDPDFWAVWSSQVSDGETVEREVDWKKSVDDWQQVDTSVQRQDSENNDE
ncbi:hypothetical protein GN155_000665 [Alcanivorax sp. ZXX171]|nr:hypothetical protein [Alcanivorax sp. ZXX171]